DVPAQFAACAADAASGRARATSVALRNGFTGPSDRSPARCRGTASAAGSRNSRAAPRAGPPKTQRPARECPRRPRQPKAALRRRVVLVQPRLPRLLVEVAAEEVVHHLRGRLGAAGGEYGVPV